MATDSGTYDDATRLRRLKLAEAMLSKPNKPITHWAEGLSEVANGYLGGKMFKQAEDDAKSNDAALNAAYLNFLKPGGSSPAPAPVAEAAPSPAAAPMGNAVAATMSASPDASLPRGFRNNNPGNIEDGPFAKSQPGYSGTDGRFAKFASMDNGTGAMGNLLGSYEKKGINTVNGIINRWAPASDGNPVSAYASTVAKEVGVDPNAPLTPELRPKVIAAMSRFENGRPLPASQPAAAPAAPVASQDATRGKIAALLSSPNPAEQKLGRTLAQGAMAQDMKGDQPTDEMREYKLAVDQAKAAGEKPPTFVEYKTGLKKAGATNVSVDTKGENSFATEAGKVQAKRFDEIASEGQKARQMVADIDTLTVLGKAIDTGKGAELISKIGPWAESIGVPVKGLSEIQAFEAIVNRVAPNMRVPGSGAQSDFELKNFLKSLPSLGNTPEGNAIAAATMKGLQENKIRASEIGSQALNGEISRPQAEKMLRELPDPMEGYRQYKKANPDKPKSSEPAKPAEIQDGQTATNPKTGQRMIFQGGQWKPLT